ncbi:MAG: hemerythrin domain-containing protein, partial [Pseudoalteromonas marina]
MNIFEALRHDHDKQRELVDALIQTHGDTQQRHKLMDELKTELEDHAKFEERYFYNPLMFDDLTHEKARHSVAEHHEIDELIE